MSLLANGLLRLRNFGKLRYVWRPLPHYGVQILTEQTD